MEEQKEKSWKMHKIWEGKQKGLQRKGEIL
jgi:hypothetical protein